MSELTPKQRAELAEQFLREISRGIPEDERVMVGYAEEATRQTDAEGKVTHAGWWPVPWKDGKYVNSNANAYICISSSVKTPHPKTGIPRYWRGESSFGHGLALMVDDIGDGKGSKGGLSLADVSAILPPTVIVETSPSNYQFYYFLDRPEPNMRRFKAFLQAFVTSVLKDKGGDHTIKDVARFGRFPIGYNNKRVSSTPNADYKYADPTTGKPWQVRLKHADYSRRYSIDDICRAFVFTFVTPVPKREEKTLGEIADLKADHTMYELAIKILGAAKLGENGEVRENGSGKVRIMCPWGHEHTNGDPSGAYFRGPIAGADVDYVFGCAHDSHRRGDNRKTWAHFTDEVVMPYVEAILKEANRKA